MCRVLRDRVDARVGGWLGSAFNGGECVAVEAYARTRLDVALYQEPHAVRQGEAGAATAAQSASAELFKRISAAYEVLRDGDSRRAYQRAVLAGRAD